MNSGELSYYLRLAKFFGHHKDQVISSIVAKQEIYEKHDKGMLCYKVSLKNNVEYVQNAITCFLSRIAFEELWLYIDYAYKFGPIKISKKELIDNLNKLMHYDKEIFTFTSPANKNTFLVDIENRFDDKDFQVSIEICGEEFIEVWKGYIDNRK